MHACAHARMRACVRAILPPCVHLADVSCNFKTLFEATVHVVNMYGHFGPMRYTVLMTVLCVHPNM